MKYKSVFESINLIFISAIVFLCNGFAHANEPTVFVNTAQCSAYFPNYLWGNQIEWKGQCLNGFGNGKAVVTMYPKEKPFFVNLVNGYIEGNVLIKSESASDSYYYNCNFTKSQPDGICEEKRGDYQHTYTHFDNGVELRGTGFISASFFKTKERKNGEFLGGNLHGFGKRDWSPEYYKELPKEIDRALNGNSPKIQGNRFFAIGIWDNGILQIDCETKKECTNIKASSDTENARQTNSRGLCVAQKQTCLASCGEISYWNGKTYVENQSWGGCKSKCESISCR
jgi:hypothetical protein